MSLLLRSVHVSLLPLAWGLACSAGGSLDADSGDGGGADSNQDGGTDSLPGDGGDGDGGTGVDSADGGDGSDSDGGNVCQSYQATSKPNPPTILMLLDQSGSMKSTEGAQTRWAAATASVKDATAELQQTANFGLIGFPTHIISSDSDASQTCNAELKVAPGPSNAAAIAASIKSAVPTIGHTPVRAALNLARAELQKPAYAETPRYVVLVTDGLPNCKGILPTTSSGYFANYEDPSDAVAELREDGVTTFVVGYAIAGLREWSEGTEHVASTYADNMARAGGTDSHKPVSNGAELREVLADITAQVAPCSFDLDEPPRGGARYVRVSIDGTDFALDAADGWALEGDRTIALREEGAACRLLRDGGEHTIDIQVECEPVVVR